MSVRFRLPRSALLTLGAVLLFFYAAFTFFTPKAISDSRAAIKCTHRPKICGHRVVGDEASILGYIPTQAMPTLFSEDVQCFDGDVIRLADDTLYLAHPMMFKPFLEQLTQQTLEGQSTEAVLLLAQNLTEDDMVQVEPKIPKDVVRPVKLRAVLEQYASLLAQYGLTSVASSELASSELATDVKPPASPWLFLEPKRDMYSNDSLATLWGMLEELQLQNRVAIWAMDSAHYDILMQATRGRAHVMFAYMDREFSDQISTVHFPAPWPPTVEAVPPLDMFGIAKQASARWTTDVVQPAMVALWLIDDIDDFHSACMEGADMVITNRPLELLAADI